MRAKCIECNSPRCGFNKDIIDIWMRGMDKGYESALLGDCAQLPLLKFWNEIFET